MAKSFKQKAKEIIEHYSSTPSTGCSDKGSYHSYELFYPEIFDKIKKNKDLCILEVGVSSGYSLRMWRDIFSETTKIYGFDKDYSRLQLSEEEKKRFVFLPEGSQDNPDLFESCPQFDLIIDDASHDPGLTLKTWNILKSKLKEGGYYIIEDVDSSPGWSNSEFLDVFEVVDLRTNKNTPDDIIYLYHNEN
ncbi:MAG: class I SAM-dependent methyltransferase [Spirochaetia bacterium]|jgi:SAM-dependent methyltransferase|nr:class I SAM-dependent methyltransferase [Spirochaetia bacterium]